MSEPATTTLKLDLRPGKPPILWAGRGGDGVGWAAAYREELRAAVTEHGAILVRGLGLRDTTETAQVFRQLGEPMTEREAFAPRRGYETGVYSASNWSFSQRMCLHHELSHAMEFPRLMMFACLVAPTGGGATALADSPTVLQALPTPLVERFEREGWLLIRNYNEEFGCSVADAFGTDDGRRVESYCRANGIEFEWQPDGTLRTRQRRPAVMTHPVTGQRCWFNQVAFFNEWTIDPEVREFLVEGYGEDGLPFNTRFGNDEPIESFVVNVIEDVYEACTARERWQVGDLMLVDNIRTAHGREPFEGPREIIVAMTDPVRAVDPSARGH